MKTNTDWLSFLQGLLPPEDGTLQRMADHWAHDVRCVSSGAEHRRVGVMVMHSHEEWLAAGVTAHVPQKVRRQRLRRD
jgi:hypothetical protein